MPKLPIVSGRQVVRALEKLGFKVVRQNGSHIVMRRANGGCVVPDHRELKLGTLMGVLKQGAVHVDEFLSVLR